MLQGQNQRLPTTISDGRVGSHDHTLQTWAAPISKKTLFIVSSGKMSLVSVRHLAGRGETQGGPGAVLHPLQKSKAFIKNAINWYQKKTQGRPEEEAETGEGRQRGKDQNLRPLVTESRQGQRGGHGAGEVGQVIQSA